MSASVGHRCPITRDRQEAEEVKWIQTEGAQVSDTQLEAKDTWLSVFFFLFPLKCVGRKTNIKLQANEAFYVRRSFPCVGRYLKSHLKSRYKCLQKTKGQASSSHLFPINANMTFCKTNPSLRCVRPFIHFFAPLISHLKMCVFFFRFQETHRLGWIGTGRRFEIETWLNIVVGAVPVSSC